jgi:hypothetical protein
LHILARKGSVSEINPFPGQQHPGLLATDIHNTETTASRAMKYPKPNRPNVFELYAYTAGSQCGNIYTHFQISYHTRLFSPACRKPPLGFVCVQQEQLANLALLAPYLKHDRASWTLGSMLCIACNYNPSRP